MPRAAAAPAIENHIAHTMGTLVLVAILSAFAGPGAQAAPITVDFFGQVTQVSGTAVGGPYDVGDPVAGRLVYEPAGAVDQLPGDPEIGRYAPSVMRSFEINVGDYTATGDLLSSIGYVRVVSRDDNSQDAVYFRTAAIGNDVKGVSAYSFQFAVSEQSTTKLLPDDSMPNVTDMEVLKAALPVLPVGAGINHLLFGGPGLDRVDWSITSYVVTPEPSTGMLVFFGLALLARRRLS